MKDFISTSRWPIVDVCFPDQFTKEQLERHFIRLRQLFQRNERIVLIVDLDKMRTHKKALREFATTQQRELFSSEESKVVVGVAHICDHWFGHAILTVIRSIVPPTYRNRIFRRPFLADQWARKLLAEYELPETDG